LIEKVTERRIDDNLNGHHNAQYPHISPNGSSNYHPNSPHKDHLQGDINRPSLPGLDDPLDDLVMEQDTPHRYWPHLPPGVQTVDPFSLTQHDLDRLSRNIREDLIGTDHPVLNKAAAYFFESSTDGGKKVRPMMVVLLSRALAETVEVVAGKGHGVTEEVIMHKNTAAVPLSTSDTILSRPHTFQRPDLPDAQRRLAEISEMIHTASLFHDDVIDGAETRRGVPAVHMAFGNKMAILAGDYLLARASISLARLRQIQVIETMSTIIEHLVRGEVMQMRAVASSSEQSSQHHNTRLVYYLQKNFYKTGSLMANSCRSAALLGDYPDHLIEASYLYGKHVGMAFQLVDDILDFEGSLLKMGKAPLSDLKAGIATAPVFFAAKDQPDLEIMMDRKFANDGDVEKAADLVHTTDGLAQTKALAVWHAERAMDAVLPWTPSVYRDALIQLAHKVVARTK
jgi:hexaprenyl-diphosphate synthase